MFPIPGLSLFSERRKGNLIPKKQTLQAHFGVKQNCGRHKEPPSLSRAQSHPDSHQPPHSLGFQVDTIQVRVTSVPRGLVNVTEHFSRTPAAVIAVRRDGVGVTTRWSPSPPRRAGFGTSKGKPWVFVVPHPGNPQGRRGWEVLIGFSGVAQPAAPRGGHSFPPASRSSPPALTPAEPEPKAKGAASPLTWRRVHGVVAALLQVGGVPLCDFTHFATSPGRSDPTHPGPPPCLPQPPRVPALPLAPGLGLPPPSRSLLSRSSWLSVLWTPLGGPARGGPRPAGSSQEQPGVPTR